MTSPTLEPCTTAGHDDLQVSVTDDLTLDLTALAHRVTLAASLDGAELDPATAAARETTLAIWTELTGLDEPLAVEVACQVARAPGQTVAAVVPF